MNDRPATLEEMIRLTACLAVSFRWQGTLTDEEFNFAAEQHVRQWTPFVRNQYPAPTETSETEAERQTP